MSYKYDVAILMRKENYEELKEKINTQGIDDFEVNKFNRGTIYTVPGYEDYCIIEWKYVGWDSATNEMVEIVEDYIDMLNKNCIIHKYIKIGEFKDDITEWFFLGLDEEGEILGGYLHPQTIIKIGFKD